MISTSPASETRFSHSNESQRSIDDLKTILLQNYLSGSIILGTVVFFISLFIAIQKQDYITAIFVTIIFLILFIITFVRRINTNIRTVTLAFIYIATGVLSILSYGINSNAILYFFTSILLLGILLRGLWWVGGIIFEGILISLMGLFIQFNWIQLDTLIRSSSSIVNWFTTITMTLFMAFVFVSPLAQYISALRLRNATLDSDREIQDHNNVQMIDRISELETEVDRRRSKMLAARQITREISHQSAIQDLLTDSVDLICTQFEFYYAAIFLSDDRNEFAVLRAASGEAGKQLLSQEHKLRIREEGIVGYVIARGETRFALDVGEDSVHFKNPLLPGTRSEIGIPLKTGTRIIGALDVQTDKEAAFTEEDIDILQSIADQLASAIDKSIYINDLEAQVKELLIGSGESTRGVWRSHLYGSRRNLSFIYRDDQLSSEVSNPLLGNISEPSEETSSSDGEVGGTNPTETVYSLPIKLRDQVLGMIKVRYNGKKMPVRMVNLVNVATDRLAIALENARLLENIQERAEREHTVGEISTKVRASQTIEAIMQTAVSELGKTLGVNEVSIQLKTADNIDQE
jgi:putative methionine-R-sulfoxide reductase with GAF domain